MHRIPILEAIDVQRVPAEALSMQRLRSGVHPDELPRSRVTSLKSLGREAAVVSWRWDRSTETGCSINLGLAIKYAQDYGVRFLFVDVISIDQTLPKDQLLQRVVELQDLFKTIPVIAAYDEQAVAPSELQRTLRRPWILSELRAACQNPTSITYVGHRYEPTERRDLSFANELSIVRSSGFADCILNILHKHVQMTHEADFAIILTEFSAILSRCQKSLARSDYLLAAFLLTAMHERSQTVQDAEGTLYNNGFRTEYGTLAFANMGLCRFTLGPYGGRVRPAHGAQAIQLDGTPVAVWRFKMTTSYVRNWIEVLPEAPDRIMEAVGFPEDRRRANGSRSTNRSAFLRIPKDAPTPAVSELGIDLRQGKWLDHLPDPQGITLDFNADLWKR